MLTSSSCRRQDQASGQLLLHFVHSFTRCRRCLVLQILCELAIGRWLRNTRSEDDSTVRLTFSGAKANLYPTRLGSLPAYLSAILVFDWSISILFCLQPPPAKYGRSLCRHCLPANYCLCFEKALRFERLRISQLSQSLSLFQTLYLQKTPLVFKDGYTRDQKLQRRR